MKEWLNGDVTCAVLAGGRMLTSKKSGIAPMMEWFAAGEGMAGGAAADRVVGKAAAMLFVKAGIREVYAGVLSESAREYLCRHGVSVTYETLTERIINRAGTGFCPMEERVLLIEDAEEGYLALQQKMEEMRNQKP